MAQAAPRARASAAKSWPSRASRSATKRSPGADAAGVDGDAGNGHVGRERAAGRVAQLGRGPEGGGVMPRLRPLRRTTSASSKGCVTPPIVCPLSCPLPATASTSPGRRSDTARAMAPARSPASTPPGQPASTAARIAAGSSLRGLSSVTQARSARRAQAAPISGRLPGSRSPPAPNSTCSRAPGRDVRAERGQQALQRVRRVGVVHVHGGAVRQPRRELHPPAHAGEARQQRQRALRRHPARDRQRQREQGVVGLEAAGQGQAQLAADAERLHLQRLPVRQRRLAEQAHRLAPPRPRSSSRKPRAPATSRSASSVSASMSALAAIGVPGGSSVSNRRSLAAR